VPEAEEKMRNLKNDFFAACCFAVAASLLIIGPLTTLSIRGQVRRGIDRLGYEGEALATSGKIVLNGGRVSSQPMSGFGQGWSGNAQLLWTGGQPGAVLDLILDVPAGNMYVVELHMTRAPDFGQLRIQVEGKDVAAIFDGYSPTVEPSGPVSVGSFNLGPGPRKVSFMMVGKNAKATGFLAGIDFIRLDRLEVIQKERNTVLGSTIVERSSVLGNLGRTRTRTTFEIWNGIGTVDHGARTYGTEATVAENTKNWLWWFRWSTTVSGATSAVLVATHDAPSAMDSPLAPLGLLGQKPIPEGVPSAGSAQQFQIDIGTWVSRLARGPVPDPPRLYMCIVLLDGQGQPVGSPSAPVKVTLTRAGGAKTNVFAAAAADAAAKKKALEELQAKARVYEVKILAHKLVVFPDPNFWGCVNVLKNPYYGKALHPLQAYKPGNKYCPPKDPKYQEKSTWDWVVLGAGGYLIAYDGLAHFWNGAKNYVASKFKEVVPCEWLGKKLESDCESAAAYVASNAISVGLAVVGVPPTLPDLAALEDMTKGKISDASVDYTCDLIEGNGGVCTPELRAKLREIYKKALEKALGELARAGREPECGNAKEASEHGLLPLPCFTSYPGAEVKPASGSVYEPSTVVVRVTRVKPDPGVSLASCSVNVKMSLTNYFKGGYVSGVYMKPTPLAGDPFVGARSAIPPLTLGKSVDVTLVFSEKSVFNMPGAYNPSFHLTPWLHLYNGGKGSLWAGTKTDQSIKLPNGQSGQIGCSQSDNLPVQIPK